MNAMLEWSEEGRVKLCVALGKAQSEMAPLVKGTENEFFKTQYADLAAVLKAVLPALNSNGFALIQSPSFDGEVLTVETCLAHADGGWLRSLLSLRPTKADAQGIGSATTYARRYSLMALTGVAPEGEDDDGNAASGPGTPGKPFAKPAPPRRQAPEPEPLRDDLKGTPPAAATKNANQARKDGDWEALKAQMNLQRTVPELEAWSKANATKIKALPQIWFKHLQDDYKLRKEALERGEGPLVEPVHERPADPAAEMDEAYRETVG